MHLSPGIVLCLGAAVIYCLLAAIAYDNWGRTRGALEGGFAGAVTLVIAAAVAPRNHMVPVALFTLVLAVPAFVIGAILGLIAGAIGRAVYPGAEAIPEQKRAVKRRVLLGFAGTGLVVFLALAYWGVQAGVDPFEW